MQMKKTSKDYLVRIDDNVAAPSGDDLIGITFATVRNKRSRSQQVQAIVIYAQLRSRMNKGEAVSASDGELFRILKTSFPTNR
jgi:hypothetical protein